MTTNMNRLQISLPEWQVRFLAERARREKTSIAALIRRLVQREADAENAEANAETLFEIVGMAEDRQPLIRGIAVSEKPELYLVGGAESNPQDEE